MPYNSNNGGGGGPWGGGGGNRGGGKNPWGGGNNNGGGGGGGGNQQGPDLDDLIRKGRDQLRVVLGGKGGGGRTNGTGGGGRISARPPTREATSSMAQCFVSQTKKNRGTVVFFSKPHPNGRLRLFHPKNPL